MTTAIKIENVSKKYRLGTINRDMLYKDIQSWWANLRGKPDPNAKISLIHQDRLEKGDEFWALRNINLEIEQGEIVGIIGKNGAGKSTLLKILSQITTPTEGKIHVKGRMASLLEVGTGFHPELTGRENVFLNGAILGMSRREISSKFDEIVEFSEISDFIDTPVKRYSSGMYVRLAFGVAAHLDPDILIVDEVLAVGDLEFQKKCLTKMQSVSNQGRTVLFVSHNLGTIQAFCTKTVVMQEGKVNYIGETVNALQIYQSDLNKESSLKFEKPENRDFYFTGIQVSNPNKDINIFPNNNSIYINIRMKVNFPSERVNFMFYLVSNKYNSRIFCIEKSAKEIFENSKKNEQEIRLEINKNSLMPGSYSCEISFLDSAKVLIDCKSNIGNFEVYQTDPKFLKFGTRELGFVNFKEYSINYYNIK